MSKTSISTDLMEKDLMLSIGPHEFVVHRNTPSQPWEVTWKMPVAEEFAEGQFQLPYFLRSPQVLKFLLEFSKIKSPCPQYKNGFPKAVTGEMG